MSFFKAFTSVLPSTSPPPPPAAPVAPIAVIQVEESRQPRKSKTVKLDDKERHRSDVDRNESEPTDVSATSAQDGSSTIAYQATEQEVDRVQGFESNVPGDQEPDQPILSTPETIHYNLESDADSEAVDSGIQERRHTSNSVTTTTTTTKVEERKRTDVQRADLSVAESAATQRQYVAWSSTQGELQRKPSFYRETSLVAITEAGQPPQFSTVSTVVETRRAMIQSGTMYNSVQEELKRLKSLYVQQTDCTEAILTNQHKEYERSSEAGFVALQTENEQLRQRISMLEVHRSSARDRQITLPLSDSTESTITTITTTITTITTSITTATTLIEQWKRAHSRSTGQIIISSKELEQLSLGLSSTSSGLVELQQRYSEQSGDIIAVRNKLNSTFSLCDEKDRKIASLTAEVAQLKRADTMKEEQIAWSSRISALQQLYDAQSGELASARNELQGKVSLIEEQNRTFASITAEVRQWKQSDSTKADEIVTARQTNEKLQRDLSAVTSQRVDLQIRHDAQSNDLGSLRHELQSKGSLLEERDRTITTLTAELDQWKLTDSRMGDQFAAASRDNEKLQRDLEASSSQTADLQKRYDAQSGDLVSIRTELHSKVSQLEQKDHVITSLTTEVAQWKREDTVKVEQIEAARREVEQLRRDVSAASSRAADLQKRYEAQSKELNSAHDELHQVGILYSEGRDQTPGEPSQHAVAQQIAKALEKKNKKMDELRRDLEAATSRNAELQKQHEVVSREISAIRDELKVKTSQNEGAVTSLTTQVDQWKQADSVKAEKIATTLKQVEKLQRELSTSTSQLADLQSRYEAQSRDLITVRNELQVKTSSHEGKDRTIVTLTAEVDQWKLSDANKAKEIATMNQTIETLQRNLSTSASHLAELKDHYEVQSRDLTALRAELQTKTLSHDGKDRTIASLTAAVEQWKHADAAKVEQIANTLKQMEELQRNLTSSTYRITELQDHHDVRSRELTSVRNELQTKTSLLQEGRDRTVTALTTQVEEWKRSDALKAEQIVTTREQLESLQLELTNSSSQLAEFQRRYETLFREHTSLRDQLETNSSAKDRTVASLTSQVEEWSRSDAAKVEELATARKDLEQLRRDLAASSSQIIESQRYYETKSTELTSQVEKWKRSDATNAEELVTTRKELDQFHRDLSSASSRIVEFQQRCDAQSTDINTLRDQLQVKLSLEGGKDRVVAALTSQIEQWKREDGTKASQLTTARNNLEKLQRDLSAASLRIAELERGPRNPLSTTSPQIEESSSISRESKEFYEKITTQYEVRDHSALVKLTTTVDEWLHSDARRAEQIALELEKRRNENEELREKLITLKEIYVRAPELKQIFQSQTTEIQRRFEEQSRQLKSELADRQSQLDGVQRFITTADTYADTAIIQMLQKLNAEVQQSTTFMAEWMVENFRPQVATTQLTKEQSAAMQKVSRSIGQTLVGCLVGKEVEEVALYLPIAFQAYLTYQLRWIVSSWTIENGRNELINEIYRRLQKSEAQAISGRWRSLTRNYISPTCLSDPNTLISPIIAGLSEVVMLAGCAASQAAAETKLSSKFESRISSIIEIAGKFSKMIGEVVSGDFEVFAARADETFEEETMEEDMDDEDRGHARPGGTGTGQKVLCSTHLGLTKGMQLESGKKQTLTVVKGKVILESFLVD